MNPVRVASSNLVYTGPTPDIGDLHCQRVEYGHIRSVWQPTTLEREQIAAGANVVLGMLYEPHVPVYLRVTDEQGIGEDAPEVRAKLDEWRERQEVDA